MKHLALAFVTVLVLVLCLVLGASFFLKSTVEDVTREAFTLGAPREEVALEDVSFSPLTRTVTVKGWRIRRTTPGGPVSAHASSAEAQITVRGIFACVPVIGDLLNDADSQVPLLDTVSFRDFVWSDDNFRGSVKHLESGVVRVRYGLLQQFVKGQRPPFVQTVNGIGFDSVTVRDLELADAGAHMAVGTTRLERLSGRGADLLSFENLSYRDAISPWTAGLVRFEDIRVSPALLSELAALSSSDPHGVDDARLLEVLFGNGPLFARSELKEFHAQGLFPYTIASVETEWTGQDEPRIVNRTRGFVIPTASFSAFNIPVDFRGMESLHMDADNVHTGGDAMTEQGVLRVRDLGDLSWSFTLGADLDYLSDVVLDWRDYGLTARVAHGVTPDAHAAGMLLKSLSQGLCRRDEDKSACEAIADFFDRPGSLTLRTPAGERLTLADLDRFAGSFGSLFSVSCTQGPKTLTTVVEELFR